MELMRTGADSVNILLHKLSNDVTQNESCDSEPAVTKGNSYREVIFTDDLRTDEFTYVMNESSKLIATTWIVLRRIIFIKE